MNSDVEDEEKDGSPMTDTDQTISRRSRTRSFSGCDLEHYRQQHERLEEARPLRNHGSATSLSDVFLEENHVEKSVVIFCRI